MGSGGQFFDDVLQLLNDTYPYMEPRSYVRYGNGYIFNLVSKQDSFEYKIANFCIVNPDAKKVSSCLSMPILFKDKKFVELWNTKRVTIKKKLEHSIFDYGLSLQHYGIKGQSWGIRNGPPYPLSQKTHDRVLRKYELSQKRKNTVDRGATHFYRDAYSQVEAASDLDSSQKRKKTELLNKANEELSRQVIGDISQHRVFNDRHPPRMIRGRHSVEDDLARCNPKFEFNEDDFLSPTANNCGLCSFTYDLRRRGYDVTAKASVDGIQSRRLIQDLYKDPKLDIVSTDSWYDFFDEMPEQYPEGSRGVLSLMNMADKSGHAVNFEVHNGKLMVIDAQCNDRHTAGELSFFKEFDPSYIEIMRTDNLQVNLNRIHKVCNELRPGWEKTADRYNPDWKKAEHGQSMSLDDFCDLLGIDLK